MERAFAALAKEGVDLPDGAKGYILYRQASLTESKDQRLLTWSEGKYGRGEITTALRKLDNLDRGPQAAWVRNVNARPLHHEAVRPHEEKVAGSHRHRSG